MEIKEKTGYIYVLTNESFHKENWIKIGYAEDVERRVKELSRTAVPKDFQVYCTYEIPRMQGVKDPDKLVHDLIQAVNPELRITKNREFFELYPWEAYEMFKAMAQMHGRIDKLKRNEDNEVGQKDSETVEYSIESLFPAGSLEGKLYGTLVDLIQSIDNSLKSHALQHYVAFKKDKNNVLCLWPKSGWIEVVLNAKLGTLKDDSGLIQDISNRGWTASQYALRFNEDSDFETVSEIIKKVCDLKKKK